MPTETVILHGSRRSVDTIISQNRVTYDQTVSVQSSVFSETRPSKTRTRKPTGWLNPTGYSMESSIHRSLTGTTSYNYGGDEYGTHYESVGNGVASHLDGNIAYKLAIPNGRQRAETKALLDLKDSSVNFGVAFAEAQQTLNLVAGTVNRLANGVNTLRRTLSRRKTEQALGIRPRTRRNPNDRIDPRKVPEAWIEYQYGWKPLLGDVKGSMEELAAAPQDHWVVTAKGHVKDKMDYEEIIKRDGLPFMARRKVKEFEGHFVRLDGMVDDAYYKTLSRVGLENPFEIVWEKVPWSFVVDWFLPVGDWISTWDASLGMKFRAGSYSHLIRKEDRREGVSGSTGQPWYFTQEKINATGKRRFVRLNRTVYDGYPAGVTLLPSFKNPLTVGHVANGLSLLALAFGRGPKVRVR